MRFDEVYSTKESYFSQNPSGGMMECLERFQVNPCLALDIGAGEGRNSLYLASKGFNVTAIEPSLIGAEKILFKSQKEKLNVEVINNDFLQTATTLNRMGFIVALTSLEHMGFEYLCEAVQAIKRILLPNGYFYAIVFTEEDPGYSGDTANASDCALFVKHYFRKDELKHFFSDFDIKLYREYKQEDVTHGTPHYHGKAKIFAQKPQNWKEGVVNNGLY